MDRLVDIDYGKTYNLKLLAGRNITPGGTIRDYVINETMLHKFGFHNPQQTLGVCPGEFAGRQHRTTNGKLPEHQSRPNKPDEILSKQLKLYGHGVLPIA